MNNFAQNSFVRAVLAPAAAGQGVAQTAPLDMAHWFNAVFTVSVDAIVAGGSVTLSLEARDDAADAWEALEGALTITEAAVMALEVENPSRRFIRCVITRADQNSSHDGIMSIQRRPGQAPVDEDGYVFKTLVSPDVAA